MTATAQSLRHTHAAHVDKGTERKSARASASAVAQPAAAQVHCTAGNLAVQSLLRAGAIHAKLEVAPPGDPLEQEADRVADSLVQRGSPCSCGGTCDDCRASDEKTRLQRKATHSGAGAALSSARGAGCLRIPDLGQGRPLDRSIARFFASELGHDFSNTSIHTGGTAAEAAESLRARAFTLGNRVAFARGEFAPQTVEGGRLLAHELTHVVQQARSGSARVQRQATAAKAGLAEAVSGILEIPQETREALEKVQGKAMFALLPALRALPSEVRTNEWAGLHVGGPRLVTAMRVVKALGSPWIDFAANNNGGLAALPADQIGDIMRFLGAPTEARYFKAEHFDGKFDGAVDPASGIVLFQRVKFELAPGVKFGVHAPGTPGWEAETKAALETFKAEYKQIVEQTWSGQGALRPACPVGAVKTLSTRVVITVVESGEHNVITLHSETPGGRSNQGEQHGNLVVTANVPRTETKQVSDPTGRRPEVVTNTQTTSAHEFGHSLGLHHPRCPSGDENCYGVTAEERRDVMGAGNKLQVLKRGGEVKHDDFAPFARIAEVWGKDAFPGALAKCNKWSAG
jgi:hypothetical protein